MTKGELPSEQDWHAFTARRVVSGEFGIAEQMLTDRSRATAPVAFARQVAMYLAHVVYQLDYDQVATAFGRRRSTVKYACGVVEDARDDPAIERRIARLEDRLMVLEHLRRGRIERADGRLAVILLPQRPYQAGM